MNFNLNRPPCSHFCFSKYNLPGSYSSFEHLSAYKTSHSHVNWWKFFTHLRSVNAYHFVMLEATELKAWRRGLLQRHELPADFHINLLTGSEVDTEWTNRQGDLISLFFSFRKGGSPKWLPQY